MRRRLLLSARPAVATTVAAGAALALLAGCGGSGSNAGSTPSPSPAATTSATATAPPTPEPCPSPQPSAPTTGKIDDVKVSGDVGKNPAVEFPKPFGVGATVNKVLSPGTGAVVAKNQAVSVDYTGVNGRTGRAFDSSYDPTFQHVGPADFTLADGKLVPGFIKGLVGQKIGSRVLVAIPPADGYGTGGNADAGICGSDTLVFVVDIKGIARTQASGPAVAAPANLPKVTVANGIPTAVAKGPGAAPKAPVAQTLIRGDGPKITAGQSLRVQAIVSVWATGKLETSTWTTGSPVTLDLKQAGIPKAFTSLVGQTVGSRVLVVSTPPTGVQSGDVKATDSLVYVFDILNAT